MTLDPETLLFLTRGSSPPPATILLLGLLLNLALGTQELEWRGHYHPRAIVARMVDLLERRYSKSYFTERMLVAEGTSFAIFIVLLALLVSAMIVAARLWLPFGWVLEVGLVALLLTVRQGLTEMRRLITALGRSEAEARARMLLIIRRDVDGLDHHHLAQAAIEHSALNLALCLMGPLYWYLLGQAPGLVIYSTLVVVAQLLDTRMAAHAAFGRFPERLFTLMMWPVSLFTVLFAIIVLPVIHPRAWVRLLRLLIKTPWTHWRVWPRCIMAALLDITLGGRVTIEGREVQEQIIGTNQRPLCHRDVKKAYQLVQAMAGIWIMILVSWSVIILVSPGAA